MRYEDYVEPLQKGETVKFRPKGQSMKPRINSGELVTLSPDIKNLSVGDVVLSKVEGKVILHLITAINGDRIQISNNHGYVNGWTHRSKVYGRLIQVEP
jgi:phage repressor protein C with HTH and peptisase S24 domain